jgi:hypothetical protein
MSRKRKIGHDGRVLRNVILGVLATAIWVTNYVTYFARDIRDAWLRRRYRAVAPRRRGTDEPGPLSARERRAFPPPPPPPRPVRDAEIVSSPKPRRSRRGR